MIRKYIVPALLALSVPALPIQAQTTASALAPGEALLQIAATGVTRTPVDKITLTISVGGRAETLAAARAAAQMKLKRLQDALAAKGIGRAAIVTSVIPGPMAFLGAAPEFDDNGSPISTDPKLKTVAAAMQVVVSSIAQKDIVTGVLDSQNLTTTGFPLLELRDISTARGIATVDAIGKARAEATAYASSLGMRVARILKVSNHGDISIDGMDSDAMARTTARLTGETNPGEVETRVRVFIDFAMEAKK